MKELRTIILEALGEASVLFMSQGDTKARDIIMPTEDLVRIAKSTVKRIEPFTH